MCVCVLAMKYVCLPLYIIRISVFAQMWMSVLLVITTVTPMDSVSTTLVASYASVTLAIMEKERLALA